jgi:drug/metabolite transporter (DMT)-like permease
MPAHAPSPGPVTSQPRRLSAPLLMLLASLLFSTMGVCVKLASAHYGAGEIVLYRSLVGALFIFGLTRVRGGSLRTTVPAMHFWRSLTASFHSCCGSTRSASCPWPPPSR